MSEDQPMETRRTMSGELDGATVPPQANRQYANSGEFAAEWNAHSVEERDDWLRHMQSLREQALSCWAGDHRETISRLEARLLPGSEQ